MTWHATQTDPATPFWQQLLLATVPAVLTAAITVVVTQLCDHWREQATRPTKAGSGAGPKEGTG